MEKVTKGLTNWLSSEGMTQKDVAEKLGVSEQFVNALFNGRMEFGKKTANDWQKLFGLSASWLRTGEGICRFRVHLFSFSELVNLNE